MKEYDAFDAIAELRALEKAKLKEQFKSNRLKLSDNDRTYTINEDAKKTDREKELELKIKKLEAEIKKLKREASTKLEDNDVFTGCGSSARSYSSSCGSSTRSYYKPSSGCGGYYSPSSSC